MPKALQHLTCVKRLRDQAENEVIKKWEPGFWLTCMVRGKNDNDHKLKQRTSDLRQNIFIYRTFKHWKRLPRGYPERMCSLLPWSFIRLNKILDDLVWFHRWPCFEEKAALGPLEVPSNLIIPVCDSCLHLCKGAVTKAKQNKPTATQNPSASQLCNLICESIMRK